MNDAAGGSWWDHGLRVGYAIFSGRRAERSGCEFGRVHRAAATTARRQAVRGAAVLRVYHPGTLANIAALGMGAAAIGGGAALARTPSGRLVSATSEAVDRVVRWGVNEQKRYVKLPGRVLAVIVGDTVVLREWTPVGAGREVARWGRGQFAVQAVRYGAEIGARVVLNSGLEAILTGRRGPTHPGVRRAVRAVIECGTPLAPHP